MTKKERADADKLRHYATLEALATKAGVSTNGLTLYRKLRRLECKASRNALDYCNGAITQQQYNLVDGRIFRAVAALLFRGQLTGFFINGDPRGYALKISTEQTQKLFDAGINLHRDWGGYGILAPEFTGN